MNIALPKFTMAPEVLELEAPVMLMAVPVPVERAKLSAVCVVLAPNALIKRPVCPCALVPVSIFCITVAPDCVLESV